MNADASPQSGEVRVAADGQAYCYEQFVQHYGRENAEWHWRRAVASDAFATERSSSEDELVAILHDCFSGSLAGTTAFLFFAAVQYVGPAMGSFEIYASVLEVVTQAAEEPRSTAAVSIDADKDEFLSQWFHMIWFDREDNLKPLHVFGEIAQRCMHFRCQQMKARQHILEREPDAEHDAERMEELEHAWQENVEMHPEEVSACYQDFCREFLQTELRPEQQNDTTLAWKETQTGLKSKQRSTFNVMLRRSLGYKQVADFIWQHGAPRLFNTSASRLRAAPDASEHRVPQRVAQLKERLLEAIPWLAAFAHSYLLREQHPELPRQRALSALRYDLSNQMLADVHRAREARKAIRKARRLVTERDKGKRTFTEMSSDEKALLEKYETNKLPRLSKMSPFRGTKPLRRPGPAATTSSDSGPTDASAPEARDGTATERVASAASARKPETGPNAAPEPASSSSDAAATQPVIIDLIAVKEEEEEAPPCKHTKTNESHIPWGRQVDLEVKCWSGNALPDTAREGFLQFLDGSLMQGNMRAWAEMKKLLSESPKDFDFYKMSTKAGFRGAMLECKRCGDICKMHWQHTENLDCQRKEACRQQMRQFLSFASAGPPRQQIR